MSNPLASYITPNISLDLYKYLQRDIPEHIIFDSMAQVCQRRGQSFVVPATPAEYSQKHIEIRNLISKFMNILDRRTLVFDLIDEIHTELKAQNDNQHIDQLLKIANVNLGSDLSLKLSDLEAWFLEWGVTLDTDYGKVERPLSAFMYASKGGIIIPSEVMQYIKSGISLYTQKIQLPALALLSIAVEATLRDMLATKGYSFEFGVSKVNVYKKTKALVKATQTGYSLSVSGQVPRSPEDFSSSFTGLTDVEIEIKRSINQRKKRVDLIINAPPALIDHWSTDDVQDEGKPKNLGGLGEALDKARYVENILTNEDLPEDIDVVLKAVRNNLIHFSSSNLDETLEDFPKQNPVTGVFTLRDFLNDKDLVFDFITGIPEFINAQYLKLWQEKIRLLAPQQ